MRALTLHQPWAHAVAHCGKDIENRTYAPPEACLGERLAITAAKKTVRPDVLKRLWPKDVVVPQTGLASGAVVATVTLDGWFKYDRSERTPGFFAVDVPDIEERLKSRWFIGPYGWVFTDIVALPTPITCIGWQRVWTLPDDVAGAVRLQEAAGRLVGPR